MTERGPIVCATDVGATGALATDLAARMANATGLPLQLVHVTAHGPDPVPESELTEAERVLRDRLRTRIEAAAAALEKERLRAEGLGPHTTAELIEGRPWEEVIEYATRHQASVLVVGPHGHLGTRATTRGGLTEHILGTTADRIVRHAPCPVLVGPREGTTPPHIARGRWLVAIDLSDASAAALDSVRYFARACDAEIVPLHVAREDDTDAEIEAMRLELRALVKAHLDRDLDVEVVRGEPADIITRVAERIGASMIVTGTRGRTGLAHLLLGSTAERVLRLSPVPVLAMRVNA
jgi:nucleotide-binding universal stress UspA family protein